MQLLFQSGLWANDSREEEEPQQDQNTFSGSQMKHLFLTFPNFSACCSSVQTVIAWKVLDGVCVYLPLPFLVLQIISYYFPK